MMIVTGLIKRICSRIWTCAVGWGQGLSDKAKLSSDPSRYYTVAIGDRLRRYLPQYLSGGQPTVLRYQLGWQWAWVQVTGSKNNSRLWQCRFLNRELTSATCTASERTSASIPKNQPSRSIIHPRGSLRQSGGVIRSVSIIKKIDITIFILIIHIILWRL